MTDINTNTVATENSADLLAEIAKLKAENSELKRAKTKTTDGKLTLKVAAKGGVSIYGVGRWPVTLYPSQAVVFFRDCKGGIAERVFRFILDNQDKGLEFKDGTKDDILAACEAGLTTDSE